MACKPPAEAAGMGYQLWLTDCNFERDLRVVAHNQTPLSCATESAIAIGRTQIG